MAIIKINEATNAPKNNSSSNVGWGITVIVVGVVGFIGGKLWEEHKHQNEIREMQKRVLNMERKHGVTQNNQRGE